MSEKNVEFKNDNKSLYPLLNEISNENILFQTNKANRIFLNSEHKITESKEEDKILENNISKANSNFDEKRRFNSTRFSPQANGNEFKTNRNDLPPLKHKPSLEEGKFSRTHYKSDKATVKFLKRKLNELNGEINKLRNDANVQNYNILQLNYKKKSKELTELKQENNFIRFQLEDLIRKNTKNNNIKNNNFISKNNSNNKKSPPKLGNVRDYHNKLFILVLYHKRPHMNLRQLLLQ